MASLKYWLWLSQLERVSPQQRLSLLEHFGQPDKIYFGDSGEYALVEGMTRQALSALENKSTDRADAILGDCQRLGLRIITIHDAEYPDRLRNIYDPPLLLYVQGRMPAFDDEVAIAMVGSRKVSPYAQIMGEKLAFQMAGLGALIVSGLAAGGDAAAHRGALRAGGFTAAVIAGLVHARMLVLMTSTEGIYQDPADPATLVRDVTGKTIEEVAEKVHQLQQSCVGASRAGANGAGAKLAYALESVRNGSTVIIGHARHHLSDLVQGRVPCTRIGLE